MQRAWVAFVVLCSVATFGPRAAGAVGCEDFVPAGCTRVTAGTTIDKVVQNKCYVFDENSTGTNTYDKINILAGGAIYFVDPGAGKTIDFKVSALLIEKGGTLQAGSPSCPIGKQGGKLAIGLYGDDPTSQGTKTPSPDKAGIQCLTNPAGGSDPKKDKRCFPTNDYASGHYCTQGGDDPCSSTSAPATEPANKLLEPYGNLNFDDNPWGYKTIGVAYGGTLALYGYKGAKALENDPAWPSATNDPPDHCAVPDPAKSTLDVTELTEWAKLSGTSWARLTASVDDTQKSLTTLTLDRAVASQEPNRGWQVGDEIVIGATDWYANHSEQRTIRAVIPTATGTQVQVDLLKYPHYTQMFSTGPQSDFTNPVSRTAVDMRAVVGLLSRSIQLYSLGKTPTDCDGKPGAPCFPKTLGCTADKNPNPGCYFGGHLIARQGFKQVAVQGVEFKQLGQGGRMGHYPVHFHLAKSTDYTSDPKAQRAFVKDSSVWDSMTRFVVVHGTHNVTVARNVGYLSLGHGYYVEDGSEINNSLCHNLGVGARAALQQYVNEQQKMEHWCGGEPPPAARVVPPILDGAMLTANDGRPMSAMGSDTYMPVMFWSMNQYNEFVGNAAVSVHGFGSCYWLLGSAVSGPSMTHQFAGFAAFNTRNKQAPLLRFRGNSCMTSPLALASVREVPPGNSGPAGDEFRPAISTGFTALANPYLTNGSNVADNYARPIVHGSYRPALAESNCGSGGSPADLAPNTTTCLTTILDRFSTSFNWAENNFSSVWLRPDFYLFANAAVTDQLFGGLGIVTGGDWQQAAPAYLALALNNLFVGTTQGDGPSNVYARRSGPRFPVSSSENLAAYSLCPPGGPTTCMFPAAGTGFWKGSLQPKRMITIYDGPTYADGNTFLNVGAWECDAQPCAGKQKVSDCNGAKNGELELPCGIYSSTTQPAGKSGGTNIVVPDAAIGWKQRNGFYYPPAFDYRRTSFLKSRSDSLNMCYTRAPGDYGTYDFKAGSCRHNVVDRTQTYLTGIISSLNADVIRQSGPLNQLEVGTIDFATILLDLDGSLTGATSTIDGRPSPGLTTSVSRNVFYDAPSQTPECLAHGVQTSPYTFISSVLGQLSGSPSSASNTILSGGSWGAQPAVAIYRQWKLKADQDREQTAPCAQVCNGNQYGCARASFMGMASVGQASYLTMTQPPKLSDSQTGGLYYVDTNSGAQSLSCVNGSSFTAAKFEGNKSYVLYNLFPQRDSKTTYQLYVGDVTDIKDIEFRWVRVTVHERAGGLQKVEQPCDPRQPNLWCSSIRPPNPVDGVLTVTVDHQKLLLDSAFEAASRPDYDRCMPRDLCYFDQSQKRCLRCDPQAAMGAESRCLRAGDFLPVDIASMNATDKNKRKPLDAVCEDWSAKVSGQVQINNGAKVTAMDCPAGGCLGFAFKLPPNFQPRFYQAVNDPPAPKKSLSRCFVESAWMKDKLVQTSGDTQCGTPRSQVSSDFCSDAKVDLPAEKDAAIDGGDPGENKGEDSELEVAGDDTLDAASALALQGAAGTTAVRSVVSFDAGAIESFLVHHALTRATLELTTSAEVAGEEALLDVHPLLRDFHEGDPDELPLTDLVPAAAASTRPSRVLGVVPIGGGGKRRLPVLPGDHVSPPGGPAPGEDVPGVTWQCAVDGDTDNDAHLDCLVPWATPGGDHAAATAPPIVASGPAGTVFGWDVTQDVMNGVASWLVRLQDEGTATQVRFHSEEGAMRIGDPELGPVLVLE